MAKRTCAFCEGPLPAGASKARRYCSDACWQKQYRAKETRRCSIDGCTKPLRAKGLCGTHYNQQKPNRHRKVEVPCDYCGSPCMKEPAQIKRFSAVFCSIDCQRHSQALGRAVPIAYTDCDRCGRTFTHDARQPRSRCTAGCRPAKPTPPRFHTGSCPRCGVTVTTDRLAGYNTANRYCSKRCAAKDAEARRRARKRGAHVEPVYRRRIFERDGWRCQLCKRKVDPTKEVPHPRAPTIDHIVPLAAGGTHEPANVQTACFMCNAVKGDRGTDQLRLIG